LHGNNLAEKGAKVNFNLTTKTQRHEEKWVNRKSSGLILKARRTGIFVVGKSKTAKAPWERNLPGSTRVPRVVFGVTPKIVWRMV
jgi:hypothetical protein